MKTLLLSLIILGLQSSASANGTFIESGSFDPKKNGIELNIIYGGGCKEHSYKLEIGSCLESYPVQCREVQLVDSVQDDYCRAMLRKTIFLSLEENGLSDSYFNGAFLTINSDGTKVHINLPFKK